MQILIGDAFPKFAIEQISAAKNSIKIIVFDWRVQISNSQILNDFNKALIDAASRGVQVKAIVNNDSLVDFLSRNRVKAKKLILKKLMHAKVMIFDDETALIGSHNFTMSAFTENVEISAYIDLGDEAKIILDYFNNLYGI